jgi:hypothetical protein
LYAQIADKHVAVRIVKTKTKMIIIAFRLLRTSGDDSEKHNEKHKREADALI